MLYSELLSDLSPASWTVKNFSAAAVFYQLPSLSCFSYLSLPFPFSISLFTIAPFPSFSCRYLTPCVKSEYYVTKWVEDVNKNTEGPYIRYNNIRLHYICPYSSVSLLSCSFPWPNIIFQRWELSVRVWRALAGRNDMNPLKIKISISVYLCLFDLIIYYSITTRHQQIH